MTTQKDLVLNYLKRNGTITTLECMQYLQVMDLQKIIQLLKEDYQIKDEWIKKTRSDGRKIRFKRYKLVED